MLGHDRGLRSTSPQPLRQAPSYGSRPPAISDSTVQSAVNNQLASSYGAGRMALQQGTRRGISRGRGQYAAADSAQQYADSQAEADAAQTQMGAAAANSAAQQAYENTMRSEQNQNAGLLEGLRNAQQMMGMARRSWGQDMYEAAARGQFGLDQQRLDMAPFLMRAFFGN